MPEKPRVKAPKQRTSTSRDPGRDRRLLGIGAAAAGALLGVVAVVALLGLGGGDRPSVDEVRTALTQAGCTLEVAQALPGRHSLQPDDTAEDWNTDPPTSGPHHAVAAIFGIYEEPLQLARVVHNLEHGGVFILYGDDVPDATVDELRTFYEGHQAGTIMAPQPGLGDEFALGAWVTDGGGEGNGYLAKCKAYDDESVAAFFAAFQYRGPEGFDPSQLQPGM